MVCHASAFKISVKLKFTPYAGLETSPIKNGRLSKKGKHGRREQVWTQENAKKARPPAITQATQTLVTVKVSIKGHLTSREGKASNS